MSARLRGDERVLVRVPDWLGDLVMAEPALRALHERCGVLTLAGQPRLLEVLGDALPGCARVDASELRNWRGHDVAVLFVNSFRSAWMARRAGIRSVVGWSRDARGWLLTHAFVPALERGGAPVGIGTLGRGARYLPRPFGGTCVELVHWLGARVSDPRPRLVATPAARERAARRLASFGMATDGHFTIVNCGGRPGSAKAFPASHWIEALRSRREPLVLVCGPGEEEPVREIAAALPNAHACVGDVAGLPELVALCERASLALTADSGPRHIASAVGTPLVVVCG
ncbi:MAG: glycosyltransferase family 9 protein, partial [Planctomycetes bacterium]|nr:glycosyltransferase family 9 protein [Planctomycetota bacterium]